MKCYASDYCQKDKSSCSDVCGGYRVLRALYNLSRIPERYRYTIALKPENGEDLEAFTTLDNYKNDVLSMVDEGRGLYIWGKSTGNGKTSWACKIMSYFFRKIAFNTGLENEGLYIFLPTFLEDLRDNYDNKDPEFDEVLRMIKTCRLLIIDDIGAERVTDWVKVVKEDSIKAIQYLKEEIEKLEKSVPVSRNKDGYDIISNAGDRLTEYKKRCEVKGLIGIPTGIPKLDEITNGWL